MCLWHAPKIEALPEATLAALSFRCPSCHVLKSREEEKNYDEGKKKHAAPYFVRELLRLNGLLSSHNLPGALLSWLRSTVLLHLGAAEGDVFAPSTQ